jgi:hypothetical protein
MSVVNSATELNRVAAPNLPLAPVQYDSRYQEQLNNVLRLYFNRVDNFISQLSTDTSSGNFTALTTQTANISGIGQNLVTYSNTLTNAAWTKGNSTVVAATTTPDPLGGFTAFKLIDDVVNATHGIAQPNYGVWQETFTCSIYARAGEYTKLQVDMSDLTTGDVFAIFDLTAGTVGAVSNGGSWTNGTAIITPVGGGWYRCSVSASKGGGFGNVQPTYRLANAAGSVNFAGTGSSGLYLYNAQSEAANTVGVPVITTASIVFNAPSLQLAGNTVLKLDQYGALSVSPSFPSGSLQAQAYTGTAAGGNNRGYNAVDWQTSRGAASQVASGFYSVVGGGTANTANAYGSAVFAGVGDSATGSYSFVGGGLENNAQNAFAVLSGGFRNVAGGYYNFIGSGYANSGTTSAVVTTQSATMNGTTAVTLSAPNASIRVGQLVTGTFMTAYPNNTYVSAISGTALTLSQVASGSGTATLSFYNPHGVVVGGGNNQATGSYSFIGGGGDAGVSANRNVASGDFSVVCGGHRNTASGVASFVGGGGIAPPFGSFPNTASSTAAIVVGGFSNTASNQGTFIGGGYQNTANGVYSAILGGSFGTTRAIIGNHVFPACSEPLGFGSGLCQAALLVLARQTTDATPTVLASTSAAGSNINQVILPNNSAYFFKGEVVSGVTGGGNTKGWKIEGLIKRGANAAATTLVGSTVTSPFADAGAATWALAVTADTTNGGLAVTFTGQAGTTIRTVAQIRTTEMTY